MVTEINDDSNDLENEEDFTPLEYKIQSYPADYTLDVLINKWEKGDIVIPELQRDYVWNKTNASRLIESFLMGLPVPPIFFFLQEDEKYVVIDGLQRLKTIVQFVHGKFTDSTGTESIFRLKNMNPGTSFYNKTFDELDEDDQRKLFNYVLRVIIIKQTHPADDDTSIYHIFERLNTGGVSLKDQEVRNCVYSGKLNDLLTELNNYENWRRIFGKPEPEIRKNDIQTILRYMALLNDIQNYKKPMKEFLSLYMKKNRNPSKDFIDKQEKIFKDTCDKIIEKLGERPFSKSGRPMHLSIFDSVFIAFSKHLTQCPSDIDERFKKLNEEGKFLDYVSKGTTDKETIKNRLVYVERFLFGETDESG